MMTQHTLDKNVLRDIIADTIRDEPGRPPQTLADAIIGTLAIYAPKAFVDSRLDFEAEEKYTAIARQIVMTAAYATEEWEVRHQYDRLNDSEIQEVMDLIGQSSITVTF